METTTTARSLFGRLLAATALCAGLFATSAHAELYNGSPTRVIGPVTSGQVSPAPSGGWIASDDRVVGTSLGGQGGWSIPCSPTKYDEGISNSLPRTGLQSWRVSNWFHEGCVNTVLSPAFASVAEGTSPTNGVVSSFWFRAPSSNAGLHVSSALSDAAGQRMTYAAIRDDAGTLRVQVVGIKQGAGYLGAPQPAPFDDAGMEYEVKSSTALAHDQWYQLRVSATLVIGARNDVVVYEVLDAASAVVWTSGPMSSWEDAYLAGVFAPVNTKVTISRLGFRIVENPDDLANRSGNATYALTRPTGVYIDDLSLAPGGGVALNVGFEGDRYLSDVGSDTGTCANATPATARCRSLAYAVSVAQPYNTIHVASGAYDGSVVVNKAGLRIIGEGASKPVLGKTGGATNQRIVLIQDARNVQVRNFSFLADKSYVGGALVALGDIEGLHVVDNDFRQIQSIAASSTYGLTNAISVNYSSEGATADGRSVLIENNIVHAATGPTGSVFRAGVQLDRGLGIVRNNTITSISQDIVVRFATVVPGTSTSTSVEVHNNTLLGGGAQIASPNAGPVSIDFHHNTVTAPANASALAQSQPSPNPADLSVMRVVSNDGNVPVTIRDNAFSGHGGGYRGVLIQNFPNVTLLRNTFTPEAGVADFASLVISNKELATAPNPANPPRAFNLVAQGNIFHASAGRVFKGRAVEFINDNDGSTAASSGTLSFGGIGALANTFDGNHRWYFRLDDQNCDFATGAATNCGTLNYPGVSGSIPATQIRPFRFDINATQNLFDGAAPTNPAQVALRQRTYDKLANPALGIVDYNVVADLPVVYVDDDWASNVYGDPLTFNGDVSGVAVQFGINAFASIPVALMHTQVGGTVHVARGNYSSPVLLDKKVQIIGDGEGATTATGTIISAGVSITGSGTGVAAADRLSVNNLRIANTGAGSVGVNFTAHASHIALQNVTVTGAGTAGLQLSGVTLDDLLFDHVTATANVGSGLRASTTTKASNVVISHSEFSDNSAGIILFGAASSGDGEIINWRISDSKVLRNDNADTSTFGAGLWLKTGGAGSKIDGFVIERSEFIDNGSAVPLNRTGITVRARPGTTIRNVSICNSNIFANTAALGTQATGINVYDQTGTTGYSPITVCSNNDFSGVPVSISGGEQNAANATQPIVNITGGSIPNTQMINSYVVRLSDSATFATISAALASPLTLANETILVPAGQYNENVVITQNGLTLKGVGPTSILDGTGKAGNGIRIGSDVTGVTVDGMTVRNFAAIGDASGFGACISAQERNHGTTLKNLVVSNCRGGRAGIYMGGAVDNVTLDTNSVTEIDGRGIVIWNGNKTHIRITNNTISDPNHGPGNGAIELQDGTASGVNITGNTISGSFDAGMNLVQLGGSVGSNVVSGNTITLAAAPSAVGNVGPRFGIQLAVPNGSGVDSLVDAGAIVVHGNTIRMMTTTDARDLAGIAVIRRGFCNLCGQVDATAGVVVRNNTLIDWTQSLAGDGYGIVVEGSQMSVFGNTISGSDVAIQRQAGNDGNQDLFNTYFSRGDAAQTCAMVGSNSVNGGAVAGIDGSSTRSIDTRPNALSMEPIAENGTTHRFFCTIQSAIDDAATTSGHVIGLYAGTAANQLVAEQVVVNKSVRITQLGNVNPVTITAPPAVGDLALLRVSAPNVEIDNLRFRVDLSKVGEAIRTVGGTPAGSPSGINIHHNTIVATASSGTLVAYGRRNALSLNLSSSSGYAPPGEQLTNLAVTVSNNNIDGSQDWDTGTAGNQPAFFRSAIGLDQGAGTISANTLRGRDYDGFIRYSNGAGLTVGPGNHFNGGGLYLGDGIVPVSVTANTFVPDRSLLPFADFALPVGAARWGDLGFSALRLVNAGPVSLATNIFSQQTNSVFAQNVGALTLTGNTFNAPTHGSQFRHLIVGTKVMSSGSATVAQVPIGVVATGNTFYGTAGTPAVAVELLNHDSDNATYAPITFGGASIGAAPNIFSGTFSYYFRMDGSSGASTSVAEPYLSSYGYATTPSTTMAPFGNPTPILAADNLFQGIAPGAMDIAQVQELQARTYHNDPLVVESPAAPSAMGRVEFGFAASVIPTTTSILSATPSHGVVGTAVAVTVKVTTGAMFNGTPSGTVTVSGVGAGAGASCSITNYPIANSCALGAFTATGLKTITATFTDGAAASSSASIGYQVFSAATGGTTTVTPAAIPTATDNDYTRINSAVQLLQTGDTLLLDGQFDWSPSALRALGSTADPSDYAYASWKRGSNGVSGDADDWMIVPPAGRSNVTISAAPRATAAAPYNGSIHGPGDDPTHVLEGVFDLQVGSYQGWEISNLELVDFDLAISMQNIGGRQPTDFNGVKILRNRIRVPADGVPSAGGDAVQNVGVVFGSGLGQTIADNEFQLSVGGVYDPSRQASVIGMQNETTGAAHYDGLIIRGNTFRLVGTPDASVPARVVGIWENDQTQSGTSLAITDNLFVNSTTGCASTPCAAPLLGQFGWLAIMTTSHSGGGKHFVIANNTVSKFSAAVTTLQGPIYPYAPVGAVDPVEIVGNTFLDNGVAVRSQSSGAEKAKAFVQFNRIAGTGIGVQQDNATVSAENNWWGCNEGPAAASDCTTVAGNPAAPSVTRWLKLKLVATVASIEAGSGQSSTMKTTLVDNVDSLPPADIGNFPVAPYGYTASLGTLADTSVSSADGAAQTTFTSTVAGGALITTSLDKGSASTNVLVTNSGSGVQVTVIPAPTQNAVDNDYTRINNAVQALHDGDTLILSGSFNWSVGPARDSFAAGSDGNPATVDDNWTIRLPVGVNYRNITIRAVVSGGSAVTGGATILAGGDAVKLGSSQTSFISTSDAALGSNPAHQYQNLIIENLLLDGFDHTLDFSNGSGTFPDVYNGVRIANNRFVLHADNAEGYQSAISFGYGTGIVIQGNQIAIDIGTSSPPSSYYGITNESGGGSGLYNNLLINGNVITVTGTGGPGTSPRVIGIWDNGEDSNSNVSITGNSFTGSGIAASNRQNAIIATTHSSGSRISLVRGNTVSGAAVALTTQIDAYPHYASAPDAQIVEGNTFRNNAVAIQQRSGSAAGPQVPSSIIRYNRIVGSGVGLAREAAAPGDKLAVVDATNNWWGCNIGPSASSASGCSTLAGLPVPSSWLKLRIAASPTSFVAGGSSIITTDLIASSGSLPPGELAVFPVADYGYTTSLGLISPVADTQPAGLAHATLTSGIAGGALVTTTLDNGSASTNVLVTNAGLPLNTVTVTPATLPTEFDNDYTRINNAVRAVTNGTTVILSGNFNWSETNAALSWAKGSDGIGGNGDDYAVEPPRNLAGVTITAAAAGGSTVSGGATIGAGGDLASANLEGVFSLYGGSFRNWTISNLELTGFDLAIGLFFDGGPIDAFEGTAVTSNIIRVPADGADASQNIGLHFSFGKNQTIAGNAFYLDAAGAFQGPVGMQSSTSGGAAYDGLEITGNSFTVTGTPDPVTPARVVGIWENDQAQAGTDVRISDNRFIGQPGVAPAAPGWIAIQTTSHSSVGKRYEISANTINDFSVGITTLYSPSYVYSPVGAADPVEIRGNTLVNNRIGVRTQSTAGNAKSSIQFNRIVGTAGAIGVQQSGTATVSALNNWWGCNAGPGATGCTSVAGSALSSPHLKLSIASDTPVVGAGGLALLTASVNGNSNGDDLSGTTAFPVTSIAFSDNSSATLATPTALTGSTASTRGIAGNTLSGIQTQTIATATLDSQPVSTTINVNQVSLHVDLPAAGVVGITSAPFPLVIDNNGAALTESSKVYLTVKRTPSPLAPGNLVLEYQSPSNPANWLPVVLTQQSGSTDTLIGQMSVGTLAAGTLTVNLRATSTVAGTIEFFAILVGETSNALYSSDGGSVLVATSAQLQIGLVSGSPQSAQVNTAYVAPLVVKVTDSAGNPLANVPVTFSGPTSGATVSFALPSGVTASDGTISSGTVTANSTAGAVNTAQATIHGSTCTVNCQVGFALTNTVTGSGAGLDITGDTVGVVTLPSAAPIHSSSTATVQLSAAAPTENVIAHLTISRPGGITPADLSIDYLATTQEFAACTPATPSGFWCPLTLTQSGSSLAATFGPASGFPLVDDAASTFRTRYHRGGQYTVTTTMDGVTSNQTYASGSRMVAVADLDLSGTPVASNGNTGVALDTAVSLVNSGNAPLGMGAPTPNNRDVIGEFTITPASGSITPADVVVRYFFGGNYVSINTSQNGNAITGTFGGSGFPVAAGYSATSLFRTTFLVAGNYTVTTRIIGAASATDVFAETVQTASIGTSSSNIAIDAASLSQTYNTLAHPVVVSTMPAGLAYTLTYTGVSTTVYPTSSTPPTNAGNYAVAATITSPGYSGTANEVLVVAKAASTVTIAGPLTQNFGATTALTATASPISTGSVSITYNGSATTPTAVGSYAVVATLNDPNYTGSATATLVVRDAANVAITFTAPEMSLVTPATAPFSTQTLYSGTLANTGGSTSQKVHYRITAVRIDDGNGTAGLPPAIDADDVEVCLFDPSGWAAQVGNHRNCPQDYQSLFISRSSGTLNGRASVSFRYPNLGANDILLPSTGPTPITLPPTLFQFKRGEYRVQVDVIGSDNSTIYATASDTTSVPQAAIAYNGATSGPTEQALLSTTNLSNTGGRVVGNVIVRVTLSDTSAAALSATDAEFAYLDGASFVTLPWTQSGNNLVTEFGPPVTGFELPDGHSQNTAGRGIFHRAGSYGLRYEVVDIATRTVIHATEQETLTIGPNMVNFVLSDLDQVYDGTPRDITVSPAGVPHTVVYDASCPALAPLAIPANQIAPTGAGSYCVYVAATGSYVGSASGTLVVAKAAAPVSLTGAVAGTVTRTYAAGVPQTVLATTTATLGSGGNISVSYNGSSTPPIAAGSYSLVATIVDTNYQGSTTGTLVISIAGGATITLDGVVGGTISRAYTGAQQAPVTATTAPAIAYTVTYAGSGPTVYPLTSTPPTAVGSYAVVATTADANYAPVSASGTLVVANASTATLGFSATPNSLAVNATSITSATLANSGGPIGENVLVRYTITRDVAGLVPADVALRYNAGSLQPLGLSQIGSSLVGYFGPQPGGFPVPAAYSATTAGDAVFHVAGVYSLTLDLVGVTTNTVFATTSSTVTVGQGSGTITINPSTLSAIYNGSPRPVTVTTTPAGLAYTLSYAGSPTAPTNAGSYSVIATLNDPNFSGSDTQTLTIAKAVSPVTFAGPTNVVFTGSAQNPLTATLTLESGNAAACTIAYTPVATPTNIGTYTATATCSGINYTGTASTTLTISASNATVTLSNLAQTYDGTPRPVTVTTSPAGLTTTVTYNGGAVPTSAGTYNVIATITSAGYSGTASGTLIVDKAVATVVIGNLTHVYNGVAKNATATTAPVGVPVTFTYNGSSALPVNAGSYTVVATANGPNHVGTATATLVIDKAVATVTLAALSQTYNGTPRNATVTTAPGGLAVTVSYNGSPTAPTPVGSYAVLATVVDANYQGSTSGTLVIGKATATVTLTNLAQSYTGSPVSAAAITSPAGLGVTLTYDGNATPPTAVGSYAVLATVVDANYGGTGSGTLTITKATATVTLGNLSQVFNGTPRAVSVTTSPLGLPRTITYDGSALPPSAVGSYAVLVTITDPNYTGTATGTLTITKATALVALTGLSQIYAGTPRVVTATSTPNGLGIAITYDGSATAPTNTGTYAVVATVNDSTYEGSASGTLVVTNGNATVSVSNLSQVYDGAAKPVTVTTSPAGLTTSVTYNGSTSVPIDAGTYTVVATITSPGYSGSGAGTLVIGKALATVVVGNLTHVYNGLAKAATATTTPPGVPVTFTYNGSATAPVNAGSYSVVATASNANYSGTATATLTIAKATATVTLSDLAQTYNGSPRSATVTTAPAGLAVSVSYDGNSVPPLAVGSYAVSASVVDANHQGSTTGTLVISKAIATVTLGNLAQTYTGSPISASALTTPAGLAVDLTYNGNPVAPTAVGSYTVVATITDASYSGSGSATLTIGKATAAIVIGNLSQAFDGAPKTVSVTTTPAGLPHTVTYNGAAALPSAVGSYAVEVSVNDPSYSGTATATLAITKGTALVSLSSLSQIYDGSPRPVTVTTTPSGLVTTVTYDGSSTPPTSTGTYAVVATVNDATYQGTASGTLVVTSGNATVTLSNLAQTYDGTARPVVVTTSPVGLTTSVTYNGSATVPVNAGSYTVVATVTSAGYSGTGAGTLVVAKATATVALGNLAQTYNGSARTVTATTTPAGLAVTLSYAGNPTAPVNAGTYAVTGTISDANYQGSASASLVVSKATAPVVLAGLSQTYSGAPRTVTATTTPAGLSVAITYSGSITAPVDAGSYPIVATISDSNYQGTASGTLVVAKAAATVTVSNLSQSFNGTPRAVTVTTIPAGLSTTITYNGAATVPSAVGSYAVLATISSSNYEGFGSGTLVIGDGSATITLTGLSYVYDGTPKSASATTNPTGLGVSFSYDGSPTPPTNAGSYGVVATITSSGYTGTANGTLIIGKATATVTLGSLNPTYDGTPKSATVTTSPVDLAVTYTYDGSAALPTNAGTYLVVATIINSNYSGTATGTLTIAKATATVTLSGLNQAYNGTPRSVVVTTAPVAGLATAVTYDGSATAPTAVGTYAVSATVTNPNYTGSAVGTLQITAGSANLIAANGPTSYTGTVSQPVAGPLPSVLVTDAGGNPVSGISVTFTAGANSGSLSGASQVTGSNGIATLGGWVLGATAPTQTVTATAVGVPGSVLFTATAGGSVTLTVSIDSGREYVRAGQSISHLVTIGNSGSLLATGVVVVSNLPPELDVSSVQWICVASAGSSCGSASSGSGNLPTTVNIAAGGSLSFVLTGTVLPGPTDVLTYSVSATRPVGITGSNGSASESTLIVIFRDGFEQGGDGAQWPQGSTGNLEGVSVDEGRNTLVDLDHSLLGSGRISTLARGAGGSFRVEASWIDGQAWLRLVGRDGSQETSSAWTAVSAGQTRFALSYEANANGTATLTLVCGGVVIEQAIAATAAMTVYASGFSGDGVGID